MNLVASMVVRNELRRYLPVALDSLLGFCDLVVVLDDGSDDGTAEYLADRAASDERLVVDRQERSTFYEHEGRTRERLLQVTLAQAPTHVLAIDADELVTDGRQVRDACEANMGPGVWSLVMEEVWKADRRYLYTREDGGWMKHHVGVVWRVPRSRSASVWRMHNRALACGRVPVAVRRMRPVPVRASILHFGWANEAERQARYQRYVDHDNGAFHARAHLDSIMWPDRRVRLRRRPWPDAIDADTILSRTAVREQPA